MSGRPQGPDRGGDLITRLLVRMVADRRDREELQTSFDELRRRGHHGRLWYWREVLRTVWALRADPNWSTRPGRSLLESTWADLRWSVRLLWRSPDVTLVAVPTLALAVGATTALFSFADALLLRPLAVDEPDRLIALHHATTGGNPAFSSFSWPDYIDLRDGARVPEGIAAWSGLQVSLGAGPDAEPVEAHIVSGNWFDVLGVRPLAGRGFLADEDLTVGSHPVVVVSASLAERMLGGPSAAVGSTLMVNSRPFTVVGVAPPDAPSLDLAAQPALWLPLMMHRVALPGWQTRDGLELFGNRGTHWLELIARLPAGVGASAAQAELQALARRQAEDNPDTNGGWTIVVEGASAARLGPPSGRPLLSVTGLLAGVVAMVLLIACANVANLLLAKAAVRAQEMGLRLSIGASRARLVRQNLTEALLLAGVGGGLGLVFAAWSVRLLPLLNLDAQLGALDIRLDARVLAFAVALTVCTGLLFGLVPALRASSAGGGRAQQRTSGGGPAAVGMRQSLVVTQVALALVLLVGSGLTVRTLRNLERIPLGFDPENVVVARIDLTKTDLPADRDLETWDRMLASAAEVAGVSDVALAWSTPFSGGRMANDIVFESGDSVGGRGRSNVDMNVVDGGFFRTLGIPLLAGRPFTEDDRADAAPVIVLNQALADRLWPGRNPLGMRLAQWNSAIDGPGELLEVVGVAANGRYARSWRSEDRPFMWLPLAQYPRRAMTLLVRTAGAEPETLARIRAAAVAAAPGLPSPEAAALTKSQTAAVSLQRTNARLLTLFGWLAIVVALIGVYGVVSFTVARRTHEIGVRLALGARPGDVRTMIMLGSAKPILGGVVAGVLLAAVAARWLTPMLFQVTPWDPATWATVLVGVLATGLLASHLPARRATRVDPVEVLRD